MSSACGRRNHYNELIRPKILVSPVPLSPKLGSLEHILESVLSKVFQENTECDFLKPGIFHYRHLLANYECAYAALKSRVSSESSSSAAQQYVATQLDGFRQAVTAMGDRYGDHEKKLKSAIIQMQLASNALTLPVKQGYVQAQLTKRISEFQSQLAKISSLMKIIKKDSQIIQNLIADYAPIAKHVKQKDSKKLPAILRFPNLFKPGGHTIFCSHPEAQEELRCVREFYRGFKVQHPVHSEMTYKYQGYIQVIENNREYLEHWMTNLVIVKNLCSFVIKSLEDEKKKQTLDLSYQIENLSALQLPQLSKDPSFTVSETGAGPDFEQFLKKQASYLCYTLDKVDAQINEVKEIIGAYNAELLRISTADYPGRLASKIQETIPHIETYYHTLVSKTEQISLQLDLVISVSAYLETIQYTKENSEDLVSIKSVNGDSEFLLTPNSIMFEKNLDAFCDFQKKYKPLFETMIPALQSVYDFMYEAQSSMSRACKVCHQQVEESKLLKFDFNRLGRLMPKVKA